MDNLFITLFLLSTVGLMVGLVKPKWIFRWDSERIAGWGHRKAISVLFGALILLFFVLFGITAPKREVNNTLTPALTPEQMTKAEKLLKKKAAERKAAELSLKSEPQTIELTEIGCRRMLDELLAEEKDAESETFKLVQLFVFRKAVDIGSPAKNTPPNLPRFVLPESSSPLSCGKTLDITVELMIKGAKMPSYIIR